MNLSNKLIKTTLIVFIISLFLYNCTYNNDSKNTNTKYQRNYSVEIKRKPNKNTDTTQEKKNVVVEESFDFINIALDTLINTFPKKVLKPFDIHTNYFTNGWGIDIQGKLTISDTTFFNKLKTKGAEAYFTEITIFQENNYQSIRKNDFEFVSYSKEDLSKRVSFSHEYSPQEISFKQFLPYRLCNPAQKGKIVVELALYPIKFYNRSEYDIRAIKVSLQPDYKLKVCFNTKLPKRKLVMMNVSHIKIKKGRDWDGWNEYPDIFWSVSVGNENVFTAPKENRTMEYHQTTQSTPFYCTEKDNIRILIWDWDTFSNDIIMNEERLVKELSKDPNNPDIYSDNIVDNVKFWLTYL